MTIWNISPEAIKPHGPLSQENLALTLNIFHSHSRAKEPGFMCKFFLGCPPKITHEEEISISVITPASMVSYASSHPSGCNSSAPFSSPKARMSHLKQEEITKFGSRTHHSLCKGPSSHRFCLLYRQLFQTSFAVALTELGGQPARECTPHTLTCVTPC